MAKRKRRKGSASNSRINRIRSGIRRGLKKTGQKIRKTGGRLSESVSGTATALRRKQRSSAPAKNTRDKQRTRPTFDIGKGRLVYPQKGDDGKVRYLPKESAATRDEIKKGLFIKEDPKGPLEIAQGMKRKYDVGKGRFIYPVKDANGKVSYVPKEAEATKTEVANGQYIKNAEAVAKVAENLKAKYDIGKGRYVFPVEGPDQKIEYLPKEGDATKYEIGNGQFVRDEDVRELEPKAERRIRRVRRGGPSRQDPPATDDQGRRNLVSRPIPAAKDGTQLWDVKQIPQPSREKEREMLKALKPKYDLGKKRMIYPALTDDGKMIYLPLRDEATKEEIKKGVFANFAPPGGMDKFIKDNALRKEMETEEGNIRAIATDDLENALEALPKLILRPHKSILDNGPFLHQEWL